MPLEEARRRLLERRGRDWDAREVARLVAELERLELLLDFYQADAQQRYSPPMTYSSGSTKGHIQK